MAQAIPTCYRHPDHRAGVTCQRCDRPICPSCMVQASVGFHCPECASGGAQKVITSRTLQHMNRPIVTQALIAANVVVYVIGMTQGGGGGLSGGGGINTFQINWGLFGPAVADGEWYRIITSGFLHVSVLHLLMNMAALYILGASLERALGRLQFGVVYGVSLIAGSMGALILSPHDLTVGASGAIFGLLGALIVAQRAAGINIWQSGIGGLLLINLLFTFGVGGISIGGHLGGLVAGLVCGQILYTLTPRKQGSLAIGLCLAVGAVCFAGALVAAQAGV
jgi:membrane associated rhomboid family serine protease